MAIKKKAETTSKTVKEEVKQEEVKAANGAPKKPAPKKEVIKEEAKKAPKKEAPPKEEVAEEGVEEMYPEQIEVPKSIYTRNDEISFADLKKEVNGSTEHKFRILVHEPGREDGKKLTEFLVVFVNKYIHTVDINSDNQTDNFEADYRMTKAEFEARAFGEEGDEKLPFALYVKNPKVVEEKLKEEEKPQKKGVLRRNK